ncbi:MAG TPA: glutamate-5-semialdehyde dehydrogenase [Candidatus Methanofastidiosa archaeon]|nr:glutamate-5-semialdehyde dehydrogenase [Candidatus Methanofastidiosa archaeon]
MNEEYGEKSKRSWYGLAKMNTNKKNVFLEALSERLLENKDFILQENERDIANGVEKGLSSALIDRLKLDDKRIEGMSKGVRDIIALPDPVGKIEGMKRLPNGLLVGKMRTPIGSILIIYEARPNVTVDAFVLCFKSGNATILKGGSEAINSNRALIRIIKDTLTECDMDPDMVQFVDSTDRTILNDLLKMDNYIDLVIPRGGEGLIRFVAQNATMPVIKHYKGVCHVYVDEDSDLENALEIAINAKVQRPGVCNAMETLLVDAKIAEKFLNMLKEGMDKNSVSLRGCKRTLAILPGIEEATEDDWYTEYLDLILSVKVVDGVDDAIDHINKYGSHHSDAIVTNDYAKAMKFIQEVDSAAVYANASTRFTDGGEFGLGAEIGISTDKIHARGPMGLEELTSVKWIVFGNGQIRE